MGQKKPFIIRDRVTKEPLDIYYPGEDVNVGEDGAFVSLPDKLAEMQDDIEQTDLAEDVQESLDKADSALQDEDVAEVAKTGDYDDLLNKPTIPDTSNLATKTELQQQLATKQDKISAGNGIVIGNDGKTVSVDAEVVESENADGTFTVRIGGNTYTINLNHTHENMAKIVKCTEATLPQTLDNNTIYVQVDNLTTPTEIEALHIFGLEFTGGGAAPGTPRLVSPSSLQISNGIDIGNTTSGVATYSLNIKAKDLTQSLLVQWGSGSTGYSFNTSNLPTGVTYDSGTGKLTITKEAACEINGVNIPVVYTGNDTDEDAEGTIGISSSSVDGINVELPLIANKVAYEQLTAIKLTGTQWGQTDFVPTVNTDISMKLKFTSNSKTGKAVEKSAYFLTCYTLKGTNQQYALAATWPLQDTTPVDTVFRFAPIVSASSPIYIDMPMASGLVDNSLLTFLHGGAFSFRSGENGQTYTDSLNAVVAQVNPLTIGLYHTSGGVDQIFDSFDLTIYELKITDNGTLVRNYVPMRRAGVPGLYDTITGHFMSSKSSTDFVEIS